MKFTITIWRDEDGMFIAERPSNPGCVSQDKTAEEAEPNIHDAIKQSLEVCAEFGKPLTISTRQVEVVFFRLATLSNGESLVSAA